MEGDSGFQPAAPRPPAEIGLKAFVTFKNTKNKLPPNQHLFQAPSSIIFLMSWPSLPLISHFFLILDNFKTLI